MNTTTYRPGQTIYRGTVGTVVASVLPGYNGFAILFDSKKTRWVKDVEKAKRLADGGKS